MLCKKKKSGKEEKKKLSGLKKGMIIASPVFVAGVLALTGMGPFQPKKLEFKNKVVNVEYGTKLEAKLFDTNKNGVSDMLVKKTIKKTNYNGKKLGTYKVKVKAKDISNKKAEDTITVKVVDTTPPAITTKKSVQKDDGTVKVQAGKKFNLSDYVSAEDKVDGDLTDKIKVTGNVDTRKAGKQTIKLESEDSSGNTSTKTITADVEDTEAPDIAVTDTRVDLKSEFRISDYVTCMDAKDGEVTPEVSGDVDTSKAGNYDVKITAVDKAGNKSEKIVTFVVGDYTAPVLELTKDEAEVPAKKEFDAKTLISKAEDNIDGDLKDKVTISDFSTEKEGEQDITFMVADSAGNQTVKKAELTVTDPNVLLRKNIEKTGRSKLGCPYVFGAAGPTVFDCSGFTRWVFSQYGISLPHSAAGQYAMSDKISEKDARKGDLIFFANTYKPGISHVGIVLDKNTIIEASGSSVKITSIAPGSSRRNKLYGFGRVLK